MTQTLRQRMSENIASGVIASLLIIASSIFVSLAGSRVVTESLTSFTPYRFEIASAILLVSLCFGVWISRRLDATKPKFQRVRADFTVLEKTVTYQYIDRDTLRYTKTFRLKARRHGVSSYSDKYNWTGKGKITLSTMVPEHSIIEGGTRNIWRLLHINFEYPLKRGEEVTVGIRWDLQDTERTARPFMSQTIDMPTKALAYELVLPEAFGVTQVNSIVRPTIDVLDKLQSAQIIGREGRFRWEVKNPRLLHCYEMYWLDPGADATQPHPLDVAETAELERGV